MSSTGLLQPGLPVEGGRRFLLTGVISRYHLAPSWNREELAEDLRRMMELFTGELGYEHVPVMSLDPTSLQIREALRDFCTSPERILVASMCCCPPTRTRMIYAAGRSKARIWPNGCSLTLRCVGCC